MQRRKFFGLVGGALAWPIATHAQQKGRLPSLGVIIRFSPNTPEAQERVRALETGLSALGLIEGRNIHIDYRWPDPSDLPAVAAALVASRPDVILVDGASVLTAVRQATQSIPVVFTGISDPEGTGIVANLARPGGNMTGFANFEPSIGGKWLETLREIAPHLTRVGVLRLGDSHPRILQNIQANAAASATEIVDCSVQDEAGLRTAISAFDSDHRPDRDTRSFFRNLSFHSYRTGGEASPSDHLRVPYLSEKRRLGQLWHQYIGSSSRVRVLCRPNPEGSAAWRSPGAGANEIRIGH